MKKLTGNQTRALFLEYFKKQGHMVEPSASLIPHDDPTLLWINAGVAALKKYFDGTEKPACNRITNAQKSIRTNDIENVGKTARHHTFFEMLGNFSIGDYFKTEAIHFAWEFLTGEEWLAFDKDKLYITVYTDDEDAYNVWTKECGVDPSHILKTADNFWEIGTGPCGPCSEIYFDRGPEYGCGKPTCGVGCDCDRYMEIWNLVFSQFDADGKGHYERLARPNIDTGMGLERLACVMQGVGNLFEVDTVQSVLHHVEHIAGKTYKQDPKTDISIRVITDHIRSCTFMVSDGILPSNEGRGYVLRRLLRRAARHGRMLGIDHPFLVDLVETVIQSSESAYPELREHDAYIKKVIGTEEANFARTIDAGMNILNNMIDGLEKAHQHLLKGLDVFKLNDTFGFPLDLTKEIAAEQGIEVDEEGFHTEMTKQKERAREARKALGDLGWAGVEFGKDMPATEFVGYDYDAIDDAHVLAIVAEGELVDEIVSGMEAIVVLDQTPFYAEMGGQTADHGRITDSDSIENPDGNCALLFRVNNVQKNKGGKFMHTGKVIHGSFQLGDTVTASIDVERRMAIRRGHTATHLLDAALKAVLGDHVHQAGSLVEPDRLRFDFTHFESITPEQLLAVDTFVNDAILRGIPVVTEVLPIEEAKKKGAVAMFGEKYGDVVRVVEMGDVSMEFCGGTHLDNTAKVGLFRIKSEGSVASGVRRIEAITGRQTLEELRNGQEKLMRAAQLLKTTSNELESRIGGMLSEMKEIRSQLEKFKEQASLGEARSFLTSAKEVKGLKLVTAQRDGMDANALRKLGDFLRDKEPKIVGVLASVKDGKVTLLAVCGKEAVASGIKAGDIIKAIAPICGGKGGGKPDSAMGGGTEVSKVDDALAAVDDLILSKLG